MLKSIPRKIWLLFYFAILAGVALIWLAPETKGEAVARVDSGGYSLGHGNFQLG